MTSPQAWQALRHSTAAACARILAPHPRLTVSEWADEFRYLSSESSAEPGRWRTARLPYLATVMDTLGDPAVSRVVLMFAAQCGKTEALLNLLGFAIDRLPGPILLLMPTLDVARAWARDRLDPMLRDSPVLRGRVTEPKLREGSTILHRQFPGGHITAIGANSAAGLASRPIRWVLADEVDRFPASAGEEGEPVALASKRTAAFPQRKVVLASTPTTRGLSRIEMAWEESSQAFYEVPCPECGAFQVLHWPNVRWERDKDGKHLPDTARYACEGCGVLIEEKAKGAMLAAGKWVATHPERTGVAGFHISALYSVFSTWPDLVREFLAAQGIPERLKAFTCLALGELWDESTIGDRVDDIALGNRRETYPAEVPAGVGILTAAVDVQDDRLELLVVGWGRGEESFPVFFEQLHGDPAQEAVWQSLDELLARSFAHETGGTLKIASTFIDTGGHHTARAYSFIGPRQRRRIYALKGHPRPNAPILGRPSKANAQGVNLFSFGSDSAKDLLFARLKIAAAGPGFIHIPEWLDDEFLAQLGAEKAVVIREAGIPRRVYRKIRPRNEAIDLLAYNIGALVLLGSAVVNNLGAYVDAAARRGAAATAAGTRDAPPAPDPLAQAMARAQRRANWVGSWKNDGSYGSPFRTPGGHTL